ncbi:hypothetical protein M422DRAFT_270179 [Sphaerobolus stellatus SS14]|uniref:Uncharacterized protein n=1 Tax=Sphaerobolus stellatus (strain SS14) TaxID=990650 RepID=A0A0C9TGE7_SPHS4|nr:hypothetical protein M422DRAFT_270179 [Sphaerobolus stellatus SS14]
MAGTGTGCIPTASEINGAKLKVLKHMIDTVNEEKTHLEQGYYRIYLAAPSALIPTSAAAVPLPVDIENGKVQWA